MQWPKNNDRQCNGQRITTDNAMAKRITTDNAMAKRITTDNAKPKE